MAPVWRMLINGPDALTPIVHEPTIRAQLTGALPLPTGSGGHVLFNMIFAMGACDYATDNAPHETGFPYYERARAALQQDLLEGGSLVLVQGLAIMAIYLQRNDRPNTSYICLGLAIRIAVALGLHVSTPSGSGGGLTVLESETRCRVWWCLVTLETGMCMTYGRNHALSLPSLSTARLPVNTDDEHLTVSTSQPPPDSAGITRYTPLIKQAKLANVVLHSLDRISGSLPSPTVEQVKWCGTTSGISSRHCRRTCRRRLLIPMGSRLRCRAGRLATTCRISTGLSSSPPRGTPMGKRPRTSRFGESPSELCGTRGTRKEKRG